MKKEFWKDWKRKTKIEEEAIKSVRIAKKIILAELPKDKIVSIYVGGTFVRREMNKNSDVDLWVVLTDSRLIRSVENLHKKYRYLFKPPIGIQSYSLKELKTGKTISKKPKVNPLKFLKRINDFCLIHGTKLHPEEFSIRSEIEEIKRTFRFFRKTLIPNYEKEKKGFSNLIKQTFWLVDLEERVKGKTSPHTWKKLDESIKNKRHIIHQTYNLRLNPTKNKKIRAAYLRRLKNYLNKLEKIK